MSCALYAKQINGSILKMEKNSNVLIMYMFGTNKKDRNGQTYTERNDRMVKLTITCPQEPNFYGG